MTGMGKISNQEISYQTIYRNIRYPRLEFKTGNLVLILPKGNRNAEEIIRKHEKWIYNKSILIKKALKDSKDKKLNLEKRNGELKKVVNYLVGVFSKEFRGKINKIFIRKMKSKWGSLSAKRNITMNALVKYLPEWLIRYIVFHEIVHLIERKHNGKFWRIIEKRYKNYAKYELYLLKYWFVIQKKMELGYGRTGSTCHNQEQNR